MPVIGDAQGGRRRDEGGSEAPALMDAKASSVFWLGKFLQLADKAELIGAVETTKRLVALRTDYEAHINISTKQKKQTTGENRQ